jgi:hypothetical protein
MNDMNKTSISLLCHNWKENDKTYSCELLNGACVIVPKEDPIIFSIAGIMVPFSEDLVNQCNKHRKPQAVEKASTITTLDALYTLLNSIPCKEGKGDGWEVEKDYQDLGEGNDRWTGGYVLTVDISVDVYLEIELADDFTDQLRATGWEWNDTREHEGQYSLICTSPIC